MSDDTAAIVTRNHAFYGSWLPSQGSAVPPCDVQHCQLVPVSSRVGTVSVRGRTTLCGTSREKQQKAHDAGRPHAQHGRGARK